MVTLSAIDTAAHFGNTMNHTKYQQLPPSRQHSERPYNLLQSQYWIYDPEIGDYKRPARFLLTLTGIALVTTAAINPINLAVTLPWLLPSGIAALSLGQVITSRNRTNTLAIGASLVICTMIAALLFAVVPVTTSSVLLAAGTFFSNKILFDVNMKKMLKSITHFFQRNSVHSWSFWKKIIANVLPGSLALYLSSIWTISMYIGASSFITHSFLASSVLITPYLAIPLLAICFACNLAFAKKGLDTTFNVLYKLYQCMTTDQKFSDSPNTEAVTYKKGWQALLRYLLHFKISDNDPDKRFYYTRSKRVAKRLAMLAVAVGAGYLSQHAVYVKFISRIATFHFSGIMASPMAQHFLRISLTCTALITSAIAARIAIITPKIFNTLALNARRVSKFSFKSTGEALHQFVQSKLSAPSIKDFIKPYVVSANARESIIEKWDTKIYKQPNLEQQSAIRANKKSELESLENTTNEEYNWLYTRMPWYNKSWYVMQASAQQLLKLLALPAILSNAYSNQYFATDTTEKVTNVMTSLGVNLNAYASSSRKKLTLCKETKPITTPTGETNQTKTLSSVDSVSTISGCGREGTPSPLGDFDTKGMEGSRAKTSLLKIGL